MLEKIDTKLTAFEIYTIFKDEDYSFILDSSLNNSLGRYSLISAQPFEVLKYDAQQHHLERLRAELDKYQVENKTDLPFIGGAVGYLAYDLCHAIEDLPQTAQKELAIPDLYLGLYNWVIVVDHRQEEVYFASPDLNRTQEEQIKGEVIAKIKRAERNNVSTPEDLQIKCSQLESNFSQGDYLAAIRQIQDYIETGAIYQVNLSQKLVGQIDCTGYQLYKRLRELSPAPFGAFLDFPELEILSNSPERFIKVRAGIIQTRPIKGTRPRGKTQEEDQKMRRELLASEKDKAELLMIVDLERNDLAKVSEVGTVKVPDLYQLEEYQNVHHLVATVESKLKQDKDLVDLIKAAFPGGSITGAPKIRAMEIIDELEPTQRNIYTGAIGYLGFDGSLDLNIAIRTIVKVGERISFQVGGGITWDSNPLAEYEETLHKAEAIIKAVGGYYEG